MKINSRYRKGGIVSFPKHTGEKIYMVPFLKREGLPSHISRWQSVVDVMLEDIETDQPIYIMVDQGIVKAGNPHRRGGIHIDGNWMPDIQAHGGGSWIPTPIHSPFPTHEHTELKPEALILSSDVSACAFYKGEIEAQVGDGGDCSHLDLSSFNRELAEPNRVYIGNVTVLHESLPVLKSCQRTVVRLNCPGVIGA